MVVLKIRNFLFFFLSKRKLNRVKKHVFFFFYLKTEILLKMIMKLRANIWNNCPIPSSPYYGPTNEVKNMKLIMIF